MSVLTSCNLLKGIQVEPVVDTAPILIEMIPELPELPEWPDVKLQYSAECQHYWFSETDVDLILDYWENKIPVYKYQMDIYSKQMEVIKKSLH